MARVKPIAILAAAWALFVAYAWPGIMTWDSINQLIQARNHQLTTWHPPMMAWLWGLLDHIVAGPLLMLLLQTALLAIGLYALFRHYWSPMKASIVASCVFLFPPVFAPMSAIWKDSLMAGCLLCGVAGLIATRPLARTGGWIALFAAAALRHNAPILILPLTAMLVPYARGWRRIAIGTGLGLALCGAASLTNRVLADVDDHPFANMLALPDLAGLLARAPDIDDATARELLDGAPLRLETGIQARARQIKPERTGWVAVTEDKPPLFALATSNDDASGATAAWWRTLTTYPSAYLAYRVHVFLGTIGWSSRGSPFVTANEERARDIGYVGEVRDYSAFQLTIADGLHAISGWIIFWPVLYLVLGIGLVVLCWRDMVIRALVGGALAYEATLFFVSPGGHDYRYSHWMIVCVVIAAVIRVVTAFATAEPRGTSDLAPANPLART